MRPHCYLFFHVTSPAVPSLLPSLAGSCNGESSSASQTKRHPAPLLSQMGRKHQPPLRGQRWLSAPALTSSSNSLPMAKRMDRCQGLQKMLGRMQIGSSRRWRVYQSSSLRRFCFTISPQRWPQWFPNHLRGLLLARQPRLKPCAYQANSVLNISAAAEEAFPFRFYLCLILKKIKVSHQMGILLLEFSKETCWFRRDQFNDTYFTKKKKRSISANKSKMSFILLKNSVEKEAQIAETWCPAASDFFS